MSSQITNNDPKNPKQSSHENEQVSQALRIATRGSMLALWQARHVTNLLKEQSVATELNVIKTTGDAVQDRFLHEIGGKGLFVRELEDAMLKGEAALAVHSLKDMPVNLPAGFSLPTILPRHKSGDLLIVRNVVAKTLNLFTSDTPLAASDFAALGAMTIASSSLRRSCLLGIAAPKIKTVPVRGNVDTRLRKLHEGQFDAIILAEASIERLGSALDTSNFVLRPIDQTWFVPCAGQGALAIEVYEDGPMKSDPAYLGLIAALSALSCSKTKRAVTMERNVLRVLGGDCTMPFGCHVTYSKGIWTGRAIVLDQQKNFAKAEVSIADSGTPGESDEKIVKALLNLLGENGVTDILKNLGLAIPGEFSRH